MSGAEKKRGQWPLSIVTAVTQGEDGLVRRATVKTVKGEYERPVQKLALLEGED